jgi:hypothetical protein
MGNISISHHQSLTPPRIVFAALLRIGWHIKRDTAGSHRVLFAKKTGLRPNDL